VAARKDAAAAQSRAVFASIYNIDRAPVILLTDGVGLSRRGTSPSPPHHLAEAAMVAVPRRR
jgi:hypothetical protein